MLGNVTDGVEILIVAKPDVPSERTPISVNAEVAAKVTERPKAPPDDNPTRPLSIDTVIDSRAAPETVLVMLFRVTRITALLFADAVALVAITESTVTA